MGFPFTEDVEGGEGNWEPEGQWAVVESDSHSPSHAWSLNPAGEYQRNTNFALELAGSITVPTGAVRPELTYYDRGLQRHDGLELESLRG